MYEAKGNYFTVKFRNHVGYNSRLISGIGTRQGLSLVTADVEPKGVGANK